MVGPGTVLLVASAGGHLRELEALAPRLVPPGWRHVWLVPAGPQADQLDSSHPVHRLHPTAPRDWKATLRNVIPAGRTLRQVRPVAVVSTGAAVAVPSLGLARLRGVEAHYIESAARTGGPSLTGRMLRRLPGCHLYSQWPGWADDHWSAVGSVFDGYEAEPIPVQTPVRTLVVTLGTQSGYGFRRLVERLTQIVPAEVDVLWQVGGTDVSGLGIDAVARVDPDTLAEAMVRADAVISHAGVGSALGALAAGRMPVLVPRRQGHGEHVDDHQSQIGDEVVRRRLARAREADVVTWEDVEWAAGHTVTYAEPGPLSLRGALGRALRAQ